MRGAIAVELDRKTHPIDHYDYYTINVAGLTKEEQTKILAYINQIVGYES